MKHAAAKLFFLTSLLALSASFQPSVRAASPTLEEVLAKLEKTGSKLKSMSADITQKKWTDLLSEFDAGEKGRFLFLKKSGNVYLRKDIREPRPNHLVIREGKVVFYQPGIKQAQVHQIGSNQDKAEFLLIGFGTNRRALEETYIMKLLGRETVGSTDAVMLELTPRSAQASAFFSKIVLWIDLQRWIPVQQKLLEPTDDYLLVNFENIRLNPKLSESDFELKLPKDVKIVG